MQPLLEPRINLRSLFVIRITKQNLWLRPVEDRYRIASFLFETIRVDNN